MCGIAGLLALRDIPSLAGKLGRLSETLAHRGPDDRGFLSWTEGRAAEAGKQPEGLGAGRIGLVHRRLSIFDLSPLGWQPMGEPGGRQWIVFNGEIYNHLELRADLEAAGERFRSGSDTEVLLRLLARDGAGCLGRLTGMYAFAFVDLDRRLMLLARDPFGIKPLHYAVSPGNFAFASEIEPLLAVGAAGRTVDRDALFRFLRHGVTNYEGSTVFADIRELPPGSTLEVSFDTPSQVRIEPFWRPSTRPAVAGLSAHEAAGQLRELLIRNVELHMRADVPCAAALSGGVDSSAITSLMRRHIGTSGPLDVFTYVADSQRLSERQWAGIVADATGARVHEVHLAPERLAGEIDDLIATQEQPFSTASIWAQAHVYRTAHAAGFKIVLDGQGADEVFAGYAVFRAARLEGLMRRGHLREAFALLESMSPGRGMALAQAAGGLLPQAARDLARHAVGKPVVPGWLDAGWFGRSAVEHSPARGSAHSPLSAALRDAVTGSTLPMLLRFADRNAMAASVENRVPFLTTELADFAFGLPDELLIGSDGTLKKILRDALRGIVPDAILDRRDKIGFETPQGEWFSRHDSVRQLARETSRMPLPPCFTPLIRDELSALGDGRIPFAAHHWRAINVIRWARLFEAGFGDAQRQGAAA
jgi:asparagine synthase (glutamine-hydrolysing)